MTKSEEKQKQEACAFLRERYLYFLSQCYDGKKECKIHMYENTQTQGTIKAVDSNFENIMVKNLKAYYPPPIQSAVLRTSDIITISFR
ncbi:uncharacterized protein LOC114340328 [Diabrotica virgifera virgifera]|uniref:Uncharacterized protein LOC114340328 n=1 Tax=Diabrotica virgifera virgifera TaxID=50390 RepID=A0A6P7GNV7_DIAVI|nr:uncharacterized protein LOC114340328 [Diabrotica virgifera virgifera]